MLQLRMKTFETAHARLLTRTEIIAEKEGGKPRGSTALPVIDRASAFGLLANIARFQINSRGTGPELRSVC